MPIEQSFVFCGHIRQQSIAHLQFKKGDILALKDIQSRQRDSPWETKRLLSGQEQPHGQFEFDATCSFGREKAIAWH